MRGLVPAELRVRPGDLADKVVLVEVAGQIGLALAALLTGEDRPRPVPAQAEVPRPRDGRAPGCGV